MKKILITGKNSFVGTSFENLLGIYPNRYSIDLISLRDDSWMHKDFSEYDVVFHVAGIAHIKETTENAHLYYEVNRDLAYEIAKKAKNDGVKQFILLSSMSVYGIDYGIIDRSTSLNPKNNYGKSKLEAEKLIIPLGGENMKVAILRPPMIYGKGCKGNYLRLSKIARSVPFFPDVRNERSMIYIDNFCEFVRILIDDCDYGIFLPQNKEYVCSSEMVRVISETHNKKMLLTKIFNPILLRLFTVDIIKKVFGDLKYSKEVSGDNSKYCIVNFEESIEKTEL